MADYDLTRALRAPVEAVWTVVSDPGRLPRWLPTAAAAASTADAQVHLEGESHGHRYAVTAPFQVEEQRRRVSWASEDSGYHGWLQVTGRGDQAEVAVHITVPEDRPAAGADQELQRGMAEALDRLQEQVARG